MTRASLLTIAVAVSTSAAAEPVEYNRHVRPILAENCFPCHGPDSASRKADLRLDRRDVALAAGALAPGKPDESELVRRINETDAKEVMPPPKSHKKLTAAQKDMLRRWIAGGAEYQSHWSLIAPKRPQPPAVKNEAWVRNPIDRFILTELERLRLAPAPEADRRTLARRLSLDLTGLPPKPEDVEAFVRDPAPDAYEQYVDRLLKSPHWGEHRGRYWLDAARFADTHGIHFDNFREAWAYRDWVINAFNRNQPFDQFTVEQLAGDLLPNRTLDQQVASGFNRCNITTNEGGVIPEEYLVLYTRDRTETTSMVWMGLTAGCAVCHDHKFDPLSQREFYKLAAFFNNTTQSALDGNIKDTPPVVPVPRSEDRPRWETLSAEYAGLRAKANERKQTVKPEFEQWLKQAKPGRVAAVVPRDGLRFHAPLSEGTGAQVAVAEDGQLRTVTLAKAPGWQPGHVAAQAFRSGPGSDVESETAGDFEKDQPFTAAAWVKLPRQSMNGPVVARMDESNGFRGWDLWIENNRPAAHVVHKWTEDAMKVATTTTLKRNEWHHVAVTYDGSGKAAGLRIYVDGLPQGMTAAADKLQNTTRTSVPLTVARRTGSTRLDGAFLQDVRVYGRALPGAEVAKLARGTRAAWLAAKPADKRSPAELNELFDWWVPNHDPASRDLSGRLVALEQERATIQARGTVAHVMQERGEEALAYVLYRGEYDKRRDAVKPETPEALPPFPADLPHNRLGFAQWLLRPEHPLTARVTVNRFWQEVFGTGLVRTAGDFGVSGELPSHPELLDWLAVEFRESGWDVKQFFRLLVTSSAYRQSAATTPAKLEKDAANRWLSRGPRFRMDAEMVRDNALAASGLLVPKLGGPSVKPYQADGVWEAVAMPESNTRTYRRDSGENLYRRSMYTFWKRAAPPAMMEALNAPNRETCAVSRERTNTPLQALVTLNDVQFVESARHLAQRALTEGGGHDEGRVNYIARRLLSRPLREAEATVVKESLADLRGYYRDHAEDARKLIAVGESKADPSLDAATLAAWTMLANQMMNLDEVLNK